MKVGIRTALIVAFLFSSGFPLALHWLWPHSLALTNRQDEVREHHLLLARSLGTSLERYYRDVVGVFGAFSYKISLGDAEESRGLFVNLHFEHVCVVEPGSGRMLQSFSFSTSECPSEFPADLVSRFKALASKGGVGLTGVIASENEEPRLFAVKQEFDTLIVGAIRTTFFRELQSRVSFGQKGHATIVDADGRILAHPREDWTRRAADISGVLPVQRMRAGDSGVAEFYSPAIEEDMIAGFTSVPGPRWGVMVPQPLPEVEAERNRLDRNSGVMMVAGLAISLVIAVLCASQVAGRVQQVDSAIKQFAAGEKKARIEDLHPIIRIEELSNLVDGFNRMTTQIEAVHAETERAGRELEAAREADLEEANKSLRSEISDRQLAERALQHSEKRFRNLFESVPIAIREEDFSKVKDEIDSLLGIDDAEAFAAFLDRYPQFVKDCASKINVVNANAAAVRLHGLEHKPQLLSRVTKDLSPEALEIVKQVLIAIRKGETRLEFETTVKPVNGSDRTVMARWSVAAGYEKTYGRVLFTSIDVTEHRRAEEHLKQAQKMEAVGQLTGGVAHDFNNLLAVIAGVADLLADEKSVNPTLTRSIQLAVKRGAELTQRLLAFSRRQSLRPKVIELSTLVAGMSAILKRTLGETIELKTPTASDLWDALADPGQVENAILNLAINARDAMPNGGKLTIESANARLDGAKIGDKGEAVSGEFVMLAVSDNGSGMTEDVLAHAFEPFFTTKEVGEGSGLGLSMVYGFAKQSNGHVTIYSEPNKGTTVKLFLPRAPEAAESEALRLEGRTIPRGQGEMVLVIEDDREVRALAVQMLTNLGYRVTDVGDVASARKVLATAQPIDIVLSDVVLPGGMSGIEFAAEARARHDGLKFVFMSGYSAEAAARHGLLKPDDVLLNKPFERRVLASTLREQLGQRPPG